MMSDMHYLILSSIVLFGMMFVLCACFEALLVDTERHSTDLEAFY